MTGRDPFSISFFDNLPEIPRVEQPPRSMQADRPIVPSERLTGPEFIVHEDDMVSVRNDLVPNTSANFAPQPPVTEEGLTLDVRVQIANGRMRGYADVPFDSRQGLPGLFNALQSMAGSAAELQPVVRPVALSSAEKKTIKVAKQAEASPASDASQTRTRVANLVPIGERTKERLTKRNIKLFIGYVALDLSLALGSGLGSGFQDSQGILLKLESPYINPAGAPSSIKDSVHAVISVGDKVGWMLGKAAWLGKHL
ncbi:hypothetical protein H7097_03785 [Aeromicrobium sp.]|nr:hypothetical protein [Candidatus Saccharibacteria bacterium]